MVDSVNEIIDSIENPVELIQKVGLLFLAFCVGALISRLLLHRICRAFCKEKTFSVLWSNLASPAICLGGFVFVFMALRYIDFPEELTAYYILLSIRVLAFFCLLLLVLRVLDCIIIIVHDKLASQGKPVPVSIFFFGRIVKGLLGIHLYDRYRTLLILWL